MKQWIKKLVLFYIERVATWRLKKIQPKIIAITGSVGKTSTKEAIFMVANVATTAHRSRGNLNTEFGVPLTILEQPSGYSSLFRWLKIFWNGFWGTLFLKKNPYTTLVLEMGADKPGDIAYFMKRLTPQVGVITTIQPSHLGPEQFGSIEEIFEEKSRLVKALLKEGLAILNADDARVASLKSELKCRVALFGAKKEADFRAEDIKSDEKGLRCRVVYEKISESFHFPYLLGNHQIYTVLPAIAVGVLLFKLSLPKLASILKDFQLPPGRMNPIPGIHDTLLIDSSYNASPESMRAALEVLKPMPGRRIAVLGSMNELGEASHKAHVEVGQWVASSSDVLVTVGEKAHDIAKSALRHNFLQDQIHEFDTALQAADFLLSFIKKGDVILVKGSQNQIRLERLVKALMKEPEKAKEMLVRQDEYWEKM
ncbi:MAG: UDP-N-acetylmuramoyl-tripeptide--D-alanyl-D-alanine ligase [Candidatus Gracilibacteria bacterium]